MSFRTWDWLLLGANGELFNFGGLYRLGVSPTHDAGEIIIRSFFMKGPRTKPSQTPLLVGRYPNL